jgi:type 1 fimbria pilin
MRRSAFVGKPRALACALVAIGSFILATGQAFAACTGVPANQTEFRIPNDRLSILPGTPPGALILTHDLPEVVMHCDPAQRHMLVGFRTANLSWSGSYLYVPSAPQIGMRAYDMESGQELTKSLINSGHQLNIDIWGEVRLRPRFEFYYTGRTPTGPATPDQTWGTFLIGFRVCTPGAAFCNAGQAYQTFHFSPARNTTIDKTTCSLEGGSITLDDVQPSELTQVGNTAHRKPIDIRMTCGAGISRQARFTIADATDNTNTGDSLVNVPGSTGGGVRMQLLRNSTPLTMQSGWNEIVTHESARDIPFHAQYVRVNAPLRPGTVHGLATLTITYN